MPCEVLTCLPKPLFTRLRAALGKTGDGCLVISVEKLTLDSCNVAMCGDDNSVEGVLQKVTLNNKVNVVEITLPYSEIVDCNYRSLDELFSRALSKTADDCFVLNISSGFPDTGCDSDCTNILSTEEKLMRSFMKDDNGCVFILVAINNDDLTALDCDDLKEADETLLNKLFIPLTGDYAGHYAIRISEKAIAPVLKCYSWEYSTSDASSETLNSISDGGTVIEINFNLDKPKEDIENAIGAALNANSVNYEDVVVTITIDATTTYTFLIKHSNYVAQTYDISGNVNLITEEDC